MKLPYETKESEKGRGKAIKEAKHKALNRKKGSKHEHEYEEGECTMCGKKEEDLSGNEKYS